MSWSGPGGGAPPYQQQPPYDPRQPHQHGQQPYGQHQFQQPPYGQQNQYQQAGYQPNQQYGGPPNSGPPKKKGNPVITRYPPPPGYRGPGQAPGAPTYQQPQYPPPQGYPPQNYNQPPQGYAPPQGYQQPPDYSQYPQQGYQQPPPNYQQPPQTYPPQQGYQQYPPQQGYPPPQGYQQPSPGYPPSGYAQQQGYPPQGPPDPNAPQGYQPPSGQWQQQPSYGQGDGYNSYGPSQPPYQDHGPTSTAGGSTPKQHQSDQHAPGSVSDQKQGDDLYLAWDDWDFDFDGAIWPKGDDQIDRNLSIGVIVWHPGIQVFRALSATFDQAEKLDEHPVPPSSLGNGESVSIYFALNNTHDAFLDIRETQHWNEIKDDPIFVEFPAKSEVVPFEDVISMRTRPAVPIPESVAEDTKDAEPLQERSLMDSLELALSAGEREPTKQPKMEPAPPNGGSFTVDTSQEDILAALGVTGSPKPVFPPPSSGFVSRHPVRDRSPESSDHGRNSRTHSISSVPRRTSSYGGFKDGQSWKPPASQGPDYRQGPPQPAPYQQSGFSQPPPPQQAWPQQQGYAQHPPPSEQSFPPQPTPQHHAYSQQPPHQGFSRSPPRPPPPPHEPPQERQRSPSFDPWSADQSSRRRANGHSPARSNGTMAGSDFGDDAPEEERRESHPAISRTESMSSRKRSYAEDDDGKMRQLDDTMPRHKRNKPYVPAAYGRR